VNPGQGYGENEKRGQRMTRKKAPKDTYKQSHRMVNLCSFWETHLIEKFKIEIKRFLESG